MKAIQIRVEATLEQIKMIDDSTAALDGLWLAEQAFSEAAMEISKNMDSFGFSLKQKFLEDESKNLVIQLAVIHPFQGPEGLAQIALGVLGFRWLYDLALNQPVSDDIPAASDLKAPPTGGPAPTPAVGYSLNQSLDAPNPVQEAVATAAITETPPLTECPDCGGSLSVMLNTYCCCDCAFNAPAPE